MSLGPSNDEPIAVQVEIKLAEVLAYGWTLYPDDGEHGPEREGWEQGAIEGCERENGWRFLPRVHRPRSPIEMMVDRACGIDGGAA